MKLLVWLRHDLRVRDNPALLGALKDADEIIPVVVTERFCDDDSPWSLPRKTHYAAMVTGLAAEFERRDSRLLVRHGDPLFELIRVLEYAQADGVYFCRHNDPAAINDELRVYNKLTAMGFTVRSFEQGTCLAPEAVVDHRGQPYAIWSRYWRAWTAVTKPSPRRTPDSFPYPADMRTVGGTPQPRTFGLTQPELPTGGEPVAHQVWLDFLKNRIFLYTDPRVDDARPHTSGASPYISWGGLSLPMLARSLNAQAGTSLTEHRGVCINGVMTALAMRDFCAMRLATRSSLREELRDIMIVDDPLSFEEDPEKRRIAEAWIYGQTGIPLIDAAMRQLQTTGWMPHSLRLVVAFYLVRIGGVSWRVGCRHFARCLTDYDPATNLMHWMSVGGEDGGLPRKTPWQLQPLSASRNLDPTGRYTAQYVHELRKLPVSLIHTPWRRHLYVAQRWGVRLGINYPAPVVPVE